MRARDAWLFVASFVLSAPAFADDKAECVAAVDKAQDLRAQSKLTEARAQLLKCARQTCPPAIAQDCTQWLRDVERATPSISISARDEGGRDLSAVRVALDGAPWLATLDAKAHPLDPGHHTLRFERADGASPPVEQDVIVREGEQDRVISVTLAAPHAARTTAPTASTHGSWIKPAGVALLIAGGATLAAAGVLGGMSGASWGSVSQACRAGTAPCTSTERSDASTAGTMADWSTALFVTGGVFAAAGLVTFFIAPAPTPNGVALALTFMGRF